MIRTELILERIQFGTPRCPLNKKLVETLRTFYTVTKSLQFFSTSLKSRGYYAKERKLYPQCGELIYGSINSPASAETFFEEVIESNRRRSSRKQMPHVILLVTDFSMSPVRLVKKKKSLDERRERGINKLLAGDKFNHF